MAGRWRQSVAVAKFFGRRRLMLCLWMLIGLGIPMSWLAFQIFGARPAFVISSETTRYTEPLTDDGYLDFPRLLKDGYSLSDESPADSLMMQVRNTESSWDPVEKPEHAVGVYGACEQALGGDQQNSDEQQLDPFELTLRIENQCFVRPFTAFQQPLVAAVIAQDRDWYERLEKASYFSARISISDSQGTVVTDSLDPCTFEFDTDQIYSWTYMGRLAYRILLALGEGKIDQALRDLETWQRLDQINEVVPTRLWGYWSYTDPSLQEIAAILILSTGPLSSEATRLIKSLSSEISNERFVMPIDDRIRVYCLDALQSLHHAPRVSFAKCATLKVFLRDRWDESQEDWGRLAAEQNQILDLVVEGLQQARTYEEQCDLLRPAYDRVTEGRYEERQPDALFASVLNCRDYFRGFNRRVVHHRFVRVVVCLAEYFRQNGKYPETLGQLKIETKLGADLLAFTDPFTGHPLIYRRVKNGFLLYSVGVNCEDDFGYSARDDLPPQHQTEYGEDNRTGRSPDDIVFRWDP